MLQSRSHSAHLDGVGCPYPSFLITHKSGNLNKSLWWRRWRRGGGKMLISINISQLGWYACMWENVIEPAESWVFKKEITVQLLFTTSMVSIIRYNTSRGSSQDNHYNTSQKERKIRKWRRQGGCFTESHKRVMFSWSDFIGTS